LAGKKILVSPSQVLTKEPVHRLVSSCPSQETQLASEDEIKANEKAIVRAIAVIENFNFFMLY
jgi:hypothetical protein